MLALGAMAATTAISWCEPPTNLAPKRATANSSPPSRWDPPSVDPDEVSFYRAVDPIADPEPLLRDFVK